MIDDRLRPSAYTPTSVLDIARRFEFFFEAWGWTWHNSESQTPDVGLISQAIQELRQSVVDGASAAEGGGIRVERDEDDYAGNPVYAVYLRVGTL